LTDEIRLGGRRAVVVWGTAVAVYFLAIFHRSSLGVAGLVAADRFHITASQLSTFTVLQLLVYAAMQIPVGVLLDRFGPQRLLVAGTVFMTLAQLGFALTGT
jgi:MFS family permease